MTGEGGELPGYEQLSSLKSNHFLNESLDLRKGKFKLFKLNVSSKEVGN